MLPEKRSGGGLALLGRELHYVGGLHNLTAKRLKPSPELMDLPKTEWGVPVVSKMTDEQKDYFLKLLGR